MREKAEQMSENNVRCRACHGVGEPSIIKRMKKEIRKCKYCNSINVSPTTAPVLEPHWYSGSIKVQEPMIYY